MRLAVLTGFAGTLFFLAACSTTMPVRLEVQNSDEMFVGTATRYSDGSGILNLSSNKGATCRGNFVYLMRGEGEGVFTCRDGRGGPFQFVYSASGGAGHGDLEGEPFTFTFGDQ